MKKQPQMKFCPECGTRIKGEFCVECGKEFKVAWRKKEEKRTFRKKPVGHGLDWRDMLKVGGWIILIGIALYLYQQFGVWFYIGGGAVVLIMVAWVKMVFGGKKGRKA